MELGNFRGGGASPLPLGYVLERTIRNCIQKRQFKYFLDISGTHKTFSDIHGRYICDYPPDSSSESNSGKFLCATLLRACLSRHSELISHASIQCSSLHQSDTRPRGSDQSSRNGKRQHSLRRPNIPRPGSRLDIQMSDKECFRSVYSPYQWRI